MFLNELMKQLTQDLIKRYKDIVVVSISCSKRQKQPFSGVLKKRCSENMQQTYRGTPMPKCDFNKFALQLWHGCSPVNLLHIFRTRFPRTQLWVAASEEIVLWNSVIYTNPANYVKTTCSKENWFHRQKDKQLSSYLL